MDDAFAPTELMKMLHQARAPAPVRLPDCPVTVEADWRGTAACGHRMRPKEAAPVMPAEPPVVHVDRMINENNGIGRSQPFNQELPGAAAIDDPARLA